MKNLKTAGNILIILLAVFILAMTACTKDDDVIVKGCTDPDADNYNPNATEDDGSCVYDGGFEMADGIVGGQYYDKFYSSDSPWSTPSDPSVKIEDITNYGNFYRCKQCHGWDLLGREGAYVGRAPKTSRPNVAINIKEHAKEESNDELFELIKREGGRPVDPSLTQDGTTGSGDAHPDFSTIYTDEQIWDIVKFLKDEVMDVDNLYDYSTNGVYPNGSISYSNIGKDGNAEAGLAFYQSANCGACHGADGTSIALEGRSVGKFLRDKPYEVHHKVKFGQPGSSPRMGPTDVTAQQMKDLYKALTDEVLFPNESPSDTELEALKTSTPPEIDGVVDAAWSDARLLNTTVEVPDPGNDVFRGYVGNTNDVTMRALYDDDFIYFLAEWKDDRLDLNRQTWYYDPDVVQWKQESRNPVFDDNGTQIRQPFYEDKFALLFNVDNSVANWDNLTCLASCHTDMSEEDGFARHYTQAGESIDMWHWKSVRTDVNFQADDQYQNDTRPNGRHGDDKDSGGYSNNKQDLVINGTTTTVTVPKYMIPGKSYYYWMTQDEIDNGTAVLITEIDENGVLYYNGGSIDPNTETAFQRDGETTGAFGIPSIFTTDFVGSRGDIEAKGVYTGSGWVLEMKRALKTGDAAAQDVDFSPLADLPFGIGVFDNAGIAHGIKPGLLLKFEE